MSYHFPPGQAAGALRWQKLAAFAAKWDWQLDVITLDPHCLSSTDESRFADLPPGTRLFGARERKPAFERFEELLLDLLPRSRGGSQRSGGGAPIQGAHLPSSIARRDLRFDPRSLDSWRRANGAVLDALRQLAWNRGALEVGRRVLASGGHRLIVSCGAPHFTHEVARRLVLKVRSRERCR